MSAATNIKTITKIKMVCFIIVMRPNPRKTAFLC